MDWGKIKQGFVSFSESASTALTEFGTNAGDSINRTLDDVQAKLDDFLDDPNGFANQALTQVGDDLSGLASEFVTYVGAGRVSGDFYDWVMVLSSVETKQEMDILMEGELERLKGNMRLIAKEIEDEKFAREYLVRLMICEMIGYPAPWAYPSFLNLTQMSPRLLDKRLGYLCAASFVNPDDEMAMMSINSFRRDLASTVCMALQAMATMLNVDAIPAVWDFVLQHLENNDALVRKKAAMVLKRIVQIDPGRSVGLQLPLKKLLCDPSPSVMAASLNIYDYIATTHAQQFKDVAPAVVSILKQCIERLLPEAYDWKGTPAPWLQIKLLKVLCKLGANNKRASENMYEVIRATLKLADNQTDAGRAIIYECLMTITGIHPNEILLSIATETVSTFLSSTDHDLKYLGLKMLNRILLSDPKHALEHQSAVIECLESTDESIRVQTLQLLYTMTNTHNVTVVSLQFMECLKKTTDRHLRQDLVNKLTSLCENFSPDHEWFVRTINQVFLMGGNLVMPSVAYNLIVLIAEGRTSGENEAADEQFRIYAVNAYFELAESHVVLPATLAQVICWVLGEYSYLVNRLDDATNLLIDMLDYAYTSEDVKPWVLFALTKLVAQKGECPPGVLTVLEEYSNSHDVDLLQRCSELKTMIQNPEWIKFMTSMLPRDASCWDLEFDPEMKFLDTFISEAVDKGEVPTTPYKQPSQRPQFVKPLDKPQEKPELKYEYQAPPRSGLDVLHQEQTTSIFDTNPNRTQSSQLNEIAPITSFNDLLKAKTPQWGAKSTGKWGKPTENTTPQ